MLLGASGVACYERNHSSDVLAPLMVRHFDGQLVMPNWSGNIVAVLFCVKPISSQNRVNCVFGGFLCVFAGEKLKGAGSQSFSAGIDFFINHRGDLRNGQKRH